MMYLTNAFSINMLEGNAKVTFTKIEDTAYVAKILAMSMDNNNLTGAIGHASTAEVVNAALGLDIVHSRCNVVFKETDSWLDSLMVAQYRGPRLEEGTTTLPEGATIEWWLVTHD
jgi:hypothetical protein